MSPLAFMHLLQVLAVVAGLGAAAWIELGLAALAAKVVLGASLALGFGPIGVAHADPGIVTDSTGQLRDCTVTDSHGARADWDTACDDYWDELEIGGDK